VTRETIFQIIRDIKDPEHPHTLDELSIVDLEDIQIAELSDETAMCKGGQPVSQIVVEITPTIPHCSMAGIIGLTVVYRLMQLTEGYAISAKIKKDTHNTYQALNKQLSDKDRIFAAFENEGLIEVIRECLP